MMTGLLNLVAPLVSSQAETPETPETPETAEEAADVAAAEVSPEALQAVGGVLGHADEASNFMGVPMPYFPGMPEQASTYAHEVDWLYYFISWVSVFFVILIAGLLVYFIYRYRQTDMNKVAHGSHHNTALEISWSIAPALLLIVMFVAGFRGYLDMVTSPSQAYEVNVTAWKWAWNFSHPNGAQSSLLHVPEGVPVRLALTSNDVIHSLYVPEFRTKKDCVPGRFNKAWFQTIPTERAMTADEIRNLSEQVGLEAQQGTRAEALADLADSDYEIKAIYDLYCTEYCGTQHSIMRSNVVVHTKESFARWLKDQTDIGDKNVVEAGEALYKARGCVACHSVDGNSGIGPTWKDLYGQPAAQHPMSSGPALDGPIDEAYLVESVRYPARRIVAGYQNQMPAYPESQVSSVELAAMIAYKKSISQYVDDQSFADMTVEEYVQEFGVATGE